MRIAFIGGGNMASALIGGLRAQGWRGEEIFVAERLPAQRERLERDFGVNTSDDAAAAAADAEVVVLAVKPQNMSDAAAQLGATLAERRRLVISVAAGTRLADLAAWLGPNAALVRTMPNRPALIGAGVTALYAGPGVGPDERRTAESIMGACGNTVWVDAEEQMDTVTAVSGSGPAYFFLLAEALEASAIRLGLPPATARTLAIETARGAGRMAAESADPPETLRAQVTSKGGTTAAALAVFEAAGFRDTVASAVEAAARRSAELSGQTKA
jgi:pyrroline-5-carboxylate reductase